MIYCSDIYLYLYRLFSARRTALLSGCIALTSAVLAAGSDVERLYGSSTSARTAKFRQANGRAERRARSQVKISWQRSQASVSASFSERARVCGHRRRRTTGQDMLELLHHGVSADLVLAVAMFRARRTVARRDPAEGGLVAFGFAPSSALDALTKSVAAVAHEVQRPKQRGSWRVMKQ